MLTVNQLIGFGAGGDGGHEYWRFVLGAAQGSGSWTVNLTEINCYDETGGPDLCTGGTAFASSTYSGSSPSNAFDDNNSTRWQAGTAGAGQHIGYKFATPVNVQKFSVMYLGPLNLMPSSIEAQYSDDGVSYTTVGTFVTAAWSSGVTQTFSI